MIDWKRKLTSRKFWAAVIGFVTILLTSLNYSDLEIAQIGGIISAAGVLIAYIIGEGYTDGKSLENQTAESSDTTKESEANTE